MNQPFVFEFVRYRLLSAGRVAEFSYALNTPENQSRSFTEKITFPSFVDLRSIPQELCERILQSLHLVLGISYYKLHCAPKFSHPYALSKFEARFWNAVYHKGLGEFCYQNKIRFQQLASFRGACEDVDDGIRIPVRSRHLLGIGGGKDSIVAAQRLRPAFSVTGLIVETKKQPQIRAVSRALKIPSCVIRRELDEQLFDAEPGLLSGHVPISAIVAFLGYATAAAGGYQSFIVANEFSSNFGNARYDGREVNHQWSKSAEFERLFQNYSSAFLSPDVRYFSALRSVHEFRIVESFAAMREYFSVFSSCNRNYAMGAPRVKKLWCGECPKCVFMFLLLAAHLPRREVKRIFGQNLFALRKLQPLFRDILGFGKLKPFDCVGTFEEARYAFELAAKKYPRAEIVRAFASKIRLGNLQKIEIEALHDTSLLPAAFRLAAAKNVLLVGYGKEGKATHRYLKGNFSQLRVGVADVSQQKNYLSLQSDYEFAIKSPGVARRKMKVPYTTATNIFLSQVTNLTIGVTGTKGKSTTASLIAHLLKTAGRRVRLLGNIGVPMLEALQKKTREDEIFVLELSSYQLEDVEYSPGISVVLNLFPEHMDYHGSVENYFLAKRNIVSFQRPGDLFLYHSRFPRLQAWKAHTRADARAFDSVSVPGIRTKLIGEHNYSNMQAAIAVAEELGISSAAIRRGLQTFRPLPHRLEFVGRYRSIAFYDDAISTTPESTICALRSLPQVGTIFLGGTDRGYNFRSLEREIRERGVQNVVLFPESGEKMFCKEKRIRVLRTKRMEDAVRFAYRHTPPGTTCLLSTASPSYALWKDYIEKGEQFQTLVRRLGR